VVVSVADGVGVPACASVGVDVAVADDDSAGEEDGEPAGLDDSLGVGEPQLAFGPVASSATLGLAGTTRSVPIATVPVATTPTTDAADRFLRACFGTVQTPSFRRFPCNSVHAPRGTHRPTVTNDPESVHPFGALRITSYCH
jgi:hypothetical protein